MVLSCKFCFITNLTTISTVENNQRIDEIQLKNNFHIILSIVRVIPNNDGLDDNNNNDDGDDDDNDDVVVHVDRNRCHKIYIKASV